MLCLFVKLTTNLLLRGVHYVAGIVFYTNVLSAFCITKQTKKKQETRMEKYECEL